MEQLEKFENKDFGTKYLVKALNQCSEETQEEVCDKLEKMAGELETRP